MRKLSLFCILLVAFTFGCGKKRPPDITDGAQGVIAQKDALALGLKNLQEGLEAQDNGDKESARMAFIQANRHLLQVDKEAREIMQRSIVEIKKIVEIGGFEYDSKGAFDLLVTYLKMQNAYMDGDIKVLSVLEKQLQEGIQKVQEATVKAKQKKIEELSIDAAQPKEGVKKPPVANNNDGPDIIYPSSYVVKRNETLPSIAARHDIYNDSYMWPLIYKANRDQIKDPKTVYVNQELKIPRDIGIEDIVQARREAGAPDPDKIPKDAYNPRRK